MTVLPKKQNKNKKNPTPPAEQKTPSQFSVFSSVSKQVS